MAYTTVDKVSASLKGLTIDASSFPSSSDVNVWIAEVDSEIDTIFGTSFTTTTRTNEYLDYDGSGFVRLPYSPVVSISSLEKVSGSLGEDSPTSTSLSEGRSNDFLLYNGDGEIEFFGSKAPEAGKRRLLWSGVTGYSVTPKWVEKLATLMVAKRVVKASVSSISQKGGRPISVGNLSLGAPNNFSIDAVKQMDSEINSLIGSHISSDHVFRPKRLYCR